MSVLRLEVSARTSRGCFLVIDTVLTLRLNFLVGGAETRSTEQAESFASRGHEEEGAAGNRTGRSSPEC